ncbi:LysR family transcriptional regulator [Shewanella rhizosphaerae]|uniref:LysR family transcriptional regulator n=1 Tax=Shewanella rhizosphaerae TaxID=2864207 RepID=UPI001C65A708|nr:LysR family transcriptional regulator [Shewanella rhizosphaerae]QYK12008.1 LysR family transcriptional regulator [Shewanella rhizosphaerae]
MRLQNVDLNLFVVFDAIYTERNLTRAAERLCITQPAVSNALSRLRTSLNDPLFIRTPKAMMPTPVAENMIGQVREALKLLSSSMHLGDSFDPLLAEHHFQLGMFDVTEETMLPSLLAALQVHAPRLSISSYPVSREEMLKEFVSGRLDLAIDAPIVTHPDLYHHPLVTVPYVCLVRKEHPEVGDTLSLEQYLALSHVHVSSRRQGVGYVDAALNRLGKHRNIQVRTKHHQAAPKLVAETNLATTVPESLAKNTDLKVLKLPFEVEPIEWHLYWHRSADQDNANRWLREFITALMQGQG